ncbi:MAG: uroporphyrinogen-III C-methyltransferase [Acidimicrobiales bacterium]
MTVYLVGAGPGDPGLITVRGRQVLELADVVIHDRLSEVSLLDLAPPGVLRIDVGKSPGGPVHQDAINALLIEHGRAHAVVVRLKGGDPFVFGRGGEEAQALIEAGVRFEVVPGVTSAVAVPAYAGVPVTHRGLSTSFTVITGHSRHEPDRETNWEALAAAGDTIVVLMGVAHREAVASRLIKGGLAPSTPVAAIQWGTRPSQRTTRTVLSALADIDLDPPATLVIGAVAGLDLAWFETRPLFGKRVVVTRARDQASELSALLTAQGASVVEVPTIETVDPSDGGAALRSAVARLATYDWVVFASPNAVDRTLALVPDARAFAACRIAAVGSVTSAALERYRLVADLVPVRFDASGLVDAFSVGSGRVLLPRAAVARDVLPDGLRAKGWEVDVVDAYQTVAAAIEGPVVADAITFTSSSTVTNYVAALGVEHVPPVVACLGPVTARTATEAGLHVDIVAPSATLASLVDALTRRLEA